MSIAQSLLPEFDQEVATARRVLERVPGDKLAWKPHEKSMTMGRLASHVAELPQWATQTFKADVLDLEPPEGETWEAANLDSVPAILELFDTSVAAARDAIASASDGEYMKAWTLARGGEEILTMPKVAVVRSFVMNHLIHHRAQLGVFLRLNDVAVPQTYGPTADEPDM